MLRAGYTAAFLASSHALASRRCAGVQSYHLIPLTASHCAPLVSDDEDGDESDEKAAADGEPPVSPRKAKKKKKAKGKRDANGDAAPAASDANEAPSDAKEAADDAKEADETKTDDTAEEDSGKPLLTARDPDEDEDELPLSPRAKKAAKKKKSKRKSKRADTEAAE